MDANSETHRRALGLHGPRHSTSFALAALGVVLSGLSLSACSDLGEAAGDPVPDPPSSTAVSPPSPSASETEPAWTDEYSADQLDAYAAALARWQEYSDKTESIYREGRDTPEARKVFQEYDMQAAARIRSLAETYDAGELRTLQGPEAVSAEPVGITEQVVLISQCNDYSQVQVTRAGEPVADAIPEHVVTPILIEMDLVPGREWMVARVQLKDEKSCSA